MPRPSYFLLVRLLITGVAGFVGSHFAEYALGRGAEVHGSVLPSSGIESVAHLGDRIRLVECDLRDAAAVQRLLDSTRPHRVIHLAAQSFVGSSWQAPAETILTNTAIQLNLLEAIRRHGVTPRFLVIGSADEYGLVHEEELPITEAQPLRPLSPYAVSKVTQDLMGYQYFRSYGIPIVRSRAFNHEGPRRSEMFAASSFARQIAEIEAGQRAPVIRVGNLKARRDYTDVRDIVRGYWLLLERGEPGEVYNLCSGKAWSIQEVVEYLTGEARVRPIAVEEDASRLRPADIPCLVGDATKIRKALGWVPEVPFEQTLRDMLADWRARIG